MSLGGFSFLLLGFPVVTGITGGRAGGKVKFGSSFRLGHVISQTYKLD